MGKEDKFIHNTWNSDVDLPSVVVASSVKFHISDKGIGVDREAVGDDFPSGGYSEAGLCLVVFPKKGEGDPWRMGTQPSVQETV